MAQKLIFIFLFFLFPLPPVLAYDSPVIGSTSADQIFSIYTMVSELLGAFFEKFLGVFTFLIVAGVVFWVVRYLLKALRIISSAL